MYGIDSIQYWMTELCAANTNPEDGSVRLRVLCGCSASHQKRWHQDPILGESNCRLESSAYISYPIQGNYENLSHKQ